MRASPLLSEFVLESALPGMSWAYEMPRTPETGLRQSYAYRRVEDAYYARKAEIRSRKSGAPIAICGTVDEFASALGGHHSG